MKQPLQGYLLLDSIHITYANAVSSPLTYGFPAITGFLGAMHALNRKTRQHPALANITFDGIAVACHEHHILTNQRSPYADHTFNQTRNPILKSGKTAAIVEEGKCHITVSLVIAIAADSDPDDHTRNELINCVRQRLWQQRIAGGSITSDPQQTRIEYIPAAKADTIPVELLPAYLLMDAGNDLADITAELRKKHPQTTPLDALIDVCTLHHIPESNGKHTKWHVQTAKSGRGWLVPIPIGYQGIAPLFAAGTLGNARNPDYPAQYVEAIYTLGKWLFPYRLKDNDIKNALWHYHYDRENDRYLATQTPNKEH
ncbi:type I-F CRISPR-associated protein Csy2 [Cardiobacteriaceae bacterium TAE3-ERU3]|nr:type I-F CRISPR-associated protein Csy2 [Cardiobacteriaceae bacterium TAE3-ERU3]